MPQNIPINGVLTFNGSVAGSCAIQAQSLGGTLQIFLPNTVPALNQVLTATSVNGFQVNLGWTTTLIPGNAVYKTEVFFTSAQITSQLGLAGPPAGLQMVPAPGVGKFICLDRLILRYKYGGTAYVTAGALAVVVSPGSTVYDHAPMFTNLNHVGDTTEIFVPNGAAYVPSLDQDNQSLNLFSLGGNPTGGNGTLHLTLYYTIESVA